MLLNKAGLTQAKLVILVLSGIRNLKSVRFFNLVLRYDYSIVVTGNLAFTMLPTLMLKCSKSIRSSIVIRNGVC